MERLFVKFLRMVLQPDTGQALSHVLQAQLQALGQMLVLSLT